MQIYVAAGLPIDALEEQKEDDLASEQTTDNEGDETFVASDNEKASDYEVATCMIL